MTDRSGLLPVLGLLAATLSAGAAWAQSPENIDPAYTNLSNYLINRNRLATEAMLVDPQSGAGGNVSEVTQVGSGNVATVDIQGANNVTTQSQVGAGDLSTLVIVGSSNIVNSTQVGNGDSFSLTVQGNTNTVTQSQTGNNLSYSLQMIGASNKSISITQTGR